MTLHPIPQALTVCKLSDTASLDLSLPFYFIGRTDEEISLVCPRSHVPPETIAREDGWRGFRIQGTLDFSLIGILSKLTAILAENGVGIFAVSTFNTDYILVKEGQFQRALELLAGAGYEIA